MPIMCTWFIHVCIWRERERQTKKERKKERKTERKKERKKETKKEIKKKKERKTEANCELCHFIFYVYKSYLQISVFTHMYAVPCSR